MKPNLAIAAMVGALALNGAARAQDAVPVRAANDQVSEARARMADSGIHMIDAVVVSVDVSNRTLTVRGPKDETVSMRAGPSVRHLETFAAGHTLRVKYREEEITAIRHDVLAAPEGAGQTESVAVQAVDAAARRLTYVTAGGETRTCRVRANVKSLADVKQGDRVVIQTEGALALMVMPPPAPPAQETPPPAP